MEQIIDTQALLEQNPHPVFLVKDGTVTHVNHAAALRQVEVGMDIDPLISIGKEEYDLLTDGRLCLSLEINGVSCSASVLKAADQHIFVLDTDYEDPTLRAFAQAAQHLRQPLANALFCADGLPQSGQLLRSLYQLHRTVCNMSDAAKYTVQSACRMESRDISAFTAEVMEKATDLAAKAGKVITYTGPKAAVIGQMDAEKLERAMLNLISNAIKFTPDGAAVTVSLTRKDSKLYFRVESKNAQIPPQVQGSLFSRYLREPELEDGRWGLGLGLTMVRSAASAHNGTLLLESTPIGQKFTMTVSLQPAKSNAVRSPVLLPVDYTGGYDRALVELSDVLPPEVYE